MAYLFFEIEHRKSWFIGFLFIFLLIFYFFATYLSWVGIRVSIFLFLLIYGKIPNLTFQPISTQETWVILIISFVIGVYHWLISQHNIVENFLSLLNAEAIKQEEEYHRLVRNIVEEASIASGNMQFEAYIIPTSALNAFSLADLKGRKVIGVTEGLVAKLNRPQLEAVIGHELAHILSGDCLLATITSSIFDFFASKFEKANRYVRSPDMDLNRARQSGQAWISVYMLPFQAVIFLLRQAGDILKIFISRQREYRADAISVRLTRDPLSLAEALYIISRGWKGDGISGDGLSSIFIVNPYYSRRDEAQGLVSDLFSTHPPIQKRIDILLGMAGQGKEALGPSVGEKDIALNVNKQWFIADDSNNWLGPLALPEISALGWLKPNLWARSQNETKARLAQEYPELKALFQKRVSTASKHNCPNCLQPLIGLDYEGRNIWQCASCEGILTKRIDLRFILLRKDKHFSEEVSRKAELIIKESQFDLKKKTIETSNLLECPICRNKMLRVFFSWQMDVDISEKEKVTDMVEPVRLVVDKCIWCDLFWLERNKIEILQYIYEKYQYSQ